MTELFPSVHAMPTSHHGVSALMGKIAKPFSPQDSHCVPKALVFIISLSVFMQKCVQRKLSIANNLTNLWAIEMAMELLETTTKVLCTHSLFGCILYIWTEPQNGWTEHDPPWLIVPSAFFHSQWYQKRC